VLAVGIDAVEVERLRRALARHPRLVERLFSPAEQADVAGRRDPVPGLAARFAAKEAVMKSLSVGLGAFDFTDVEVVGAPGGAPLLSVSGRAVRLAAERSVAGWHVSLSHTDSVAVAVAVAYA
jgi:holo-[acyl-carrier protein] synthase